MIEIFHFKKGAQIIKLNTTLTNLNVQGNLMCHCRRDKNRGKPLDWLSTTPGRHIGEWQYSSTILDVSTRQR
jgi:hypothetical protein